MGKGLSFKSILSTVIRISYHPCHCNGWDLKCWAEQGPDFCMTGGEKETGSSREVVVALG